MGLYREYTWGQIVRSIYVLVASGSRALNPKPL